MGCPHHFDTSEGVHLCVGDMSYSALRAVKPIQALNLMHRMQVKFPGCFNRTVYFG